MLLYSRNIRRLPILVQMFRTLRVFRLLVCIGLICRAALPALAEQNQGHIFSRPRENPRETLFQYPGPENSGIDRAEDAVLDQGLLTGEIPAAFIQPVIPILINKEIMGKGEAETEILISFLLQSNGEADPGFVRKLADYYIEEAGIEGVNHDIAFAQMCLETGFLRYGGLVTADMNNFCGLGAIGPGEQGERFSTARIGVRAHIQHLKAYATDKPLKRELVDPRNRWVRKGSAPVIQNLAGTWAVDKQYAVKIGTILGKLYYFKERAEP